jgi:hypothetical protein
LQFATFLGGSGEDTANGVAIKPDGSAWIVGETNLLVLIPPAIAEFQPVQRALTRQRFVELLAPGQYTEQRILFAVARGRSGLRSPERARTPLRKHLQNGMVNAALFPPVQEKA